MKSLVAIGLFCLTLCAKAQVSYGDLFLVNYNMKIHVITENDSAFLYVVFTSEKNKINDTPKLLLRLMDDSIISLDGILLDSHIKSEGGVTVGSAYVANNHYVSEVKFPISKRDILHFQKGIRKLRLNTSPKYHEKEWRKDRIGHTLYLAYLNSSTNSFEDDF